MITETDHAALKQKVLTNWFISNWKPCAWLSRAENLRRAANILFAACDASRDEDGEPVNPENTSMDEPATLLYGYAIENAIKGYLIKAYNWNHERCSKLPEWGEHNLEMLFRKTGLQASKAQLMLLKLLTAHVRWAGKYPAFFSFSGARGFVLPEQYEHPPFGVPKDMSPRTLDFSMRCQMDAVFQKLHEEFDNFQPSSSPGGHALVHYPKAEP